MAEATFADGKSVIPQARPAQIIEWQYANGRSGGVGVDDYVAVGTAGGIMLLMDHFNGGAIL